MRIGLDLGGTKIEAVAIAPDGTEHGRRRVATPSWDYPATIRAICDLVFGIERELDCRATVGVGHPGAISPASGLIKNSNTTGLNGKPLDVDLARALGREVRLANDANCFALSEAVDGAAAGAYVVFGVIVGTGTGGGVVVGGRPLVGPNAVAGEWGHNPLPWITAAEHPGAMCYCGRPGCIETFLSGPGLARDHREVTGEERTAVEIAAGADRGEAACVATFERYVDRMARALASVINLLDPDAIVLGGGVSNVVSLYEAVPARWGRYAFTDRVDTRLLRARHGDASGVRGAAFLWSAEEANRV